ncbi:MAG: hypothetical protein EOO24_28225 [Comamonadaceae bacterium]|nr:MAG: hypothetical protein EOO24_28225 [Comamonadaceae bacterium]
MKHSLTLLVAAAALAGANVASAAGPRGMGGSGIYQQEVSVCGHNQQDRAACIREAGAARQAAARGDLSTPPDYRANAMARCARQEASDRASCEARVQGAGRTTVEGSVMGGGLIYETVTPLSPR